MKPVDVGVVEEHTHARTYTHTASSLDISLSKEVAQQECVCVCVYKLFSSPHDSYLVYYTSGLKTKVMHEEIIVCIYVWDTRALTVPSL